LQLEQELGSAQRALEAQMAAASQKLTAQQEVWSIERASLAQGVCGTYRLRVHYCVRAFLEYCVM
jgi:hypothetical protein